MKGLGYEMKQGKNLTFKSSKFERTVRCNLLKENYTEEIIRKRIDGKFEVKEEKTQTDRVNYEPPKINLLINIENNIKSKNSPGYEHWAKVFNLKQATQTLIYLQENNIDEYDKLKNLVSEKNNLQNDLTAKIKTIEKRLNEIKDLEKHIGNYGKTKEIYTQYKKSGYDKNFLREFEDKIILHQATKKGL